MTVTPYLDPTVQVISQIWDQQEQAPPSLPDQGLILDIKIYSISCTTNIPFWANTGVVYSRIASPQQVGYFLSLDIDAR